MQAFWFVPSAQVWRTDYERSGKDSTDVVLDVNSEDPRVQVSESVKVQDQRSSSNGNIWIFCYGACLIRFAQQVLLLRMPVWHSSPC
jgi:hypothetical protein